MPQSAQAKIHLSLCNRAISECGPFQTVRNLFLGLGDAHAIEKARIDHAAVAVIGGVGDLESCRILALGTDHGNVTEPVFVDEVEVALVMRRAAENGAGAVLHQHEIGDIDRQFPIWIEWMDRAKAGVETLLLRGVDIGLCGTAVFALRDESLERRVIYGGFLRERMDSQVRPPRISRRTAYRVVS